MIKIPESFQTNLGVVWSCIISHVTHQSGPLHIVESEVCRQKHIKVLRPVFENIHANEVEIVQLFCRTAIMCHVGTCIYGSTQLQKHPFLTIFSDRNLDLPT